MKTQIHSPTFRRILILAFAFTAFLAVPSAWAKALYTCSMHPQIVRDAPGSCPICGMTLVPVPEDRAQAGADTKAVASAETDTAAAQTAPAEDNCCSGGKQALHEAKVDGQKADATPATPAPRKVKYYKSTMMPGEVSPTPAKDSMGMEMAPFYEDEPSAPTTMLKLDSGTVQLMNLRTAPVEGGPLVREVRAVGEVAFNERTQRVVTLRFDGWIERLYVNATWTDVKAGDPLFEVYSPELYAASLNFITARRNEGASGGPLGAAAAERLHLLGAPADYIVALATADKPPRTLLVRAPSAGTVAAKNVVEGAMLKAGEPAFTLADTTSVWVLAQVYPEDAALVAKDAAAELRILSAPGPVYRGVVSLVEPITDAATRTNLARIVLPNPDGALRPGQYVDVRIETTAHNAAVLVPDEAVLRSGERNLIFVALGNGRYAPREVRLGARDNANRYEVLNGLKAGETVVTSGQFLLDSESSLREAVAKMLADNKN